MSFQSVGLSGVTTSRPQPVNVYGKAMDESKRTAHGKVVRLVLPSKVA